MAFIKIYSPVLIGLCLIGLAGSVLMPECRPSGRQRVSTLSGPVAIIDVYDNYSYDRRLRTGWGFGCVVRTEEATILFDTGSDSATLLYNMEVMEIAPEEIDLVVISHQHGDHVGGLRGFLARNNRVTVYIPSSFSRSIRQLISASGAGFKPVEEAGPIAAGIYTTGELGRAIKEQALVLDTEKGGVVITGCAHPGIVGMVRKAKELLPSGEIYLVMGGFHLSAASRDALTGIIAAFRDMGVLKVAPSHCSGDRCRRMFEEEYGSDYIEGGVGRIIRL